MFIVDHVEDAQSNDEESPDSENANTDEDCSDDNSYYDDNDDDTEESIISNASIDLNISIESIESNESN